MLTQERAKKRRICEELEKEMDTMKAGLAREKKREMAERDDIPNAHETGNSMNNVRGNAAEQEPEPTPKVPRMEGIRGEEDRYLQPAPEVAGLDNIPEDLDTDFDDLVWEMLQDIEAAVNHKCHKPLKPCPPPSTQDILLTFDSSPSQQAGELEELDSLLLLAPPTPRIEEEKSSEEKDEEEATELVPSTPHDPPLESLPSSPRRFFTPTGDYARMSSALHRSRRTAALEEIRRRYCPRVGAVMEEPAAQPPEARKPQPHRNPPKPSSPPNPSLHDDEDNHSSPPSEEPTAPDASQDSYGGDWVDEIALELLV